jgi:hypothetical protein
MDRLKLCAWVVLPALAFLAIVGGAAVIWGTSERPPAYVTTIQGGDGYGRPYAPPPARERRFPQ